MASNPEKGSKWSTNHGLSLYADLLKTDDDGSSNSGAADQPSTADKSKDGAAEKTKIQAPFHYQHVKRPQQKPKPKAQTTYAKAPVVFTNKAPTAESEIPVKKESTPPVARKTFDDFVAEIDEDADLMFPKVKPQRGGRKKRNNAWKKTKEEQPKEANWDEIYDPSRPNVYKQYKGSQEQADSNRDWKNLLHSKFKSKKSKVKRASTDDSEDQKSKSPPRAPAKYSFAPPSFDDEPIPPEPASMADKASQVPPLPQPPDVSESIGQASSPPLPPPAAGAVANESRLSYSSAPIRYAAPPQPQPAGNESSPLAENATQLADTNAAPSTKPSKKGFAQRYMEKWGHQKGSGLGASSDGIINPLSVKIEKRKKAPDSEGGGYKNRGGMGKIIGGKKKKLDESAETDQGNTMSPVVVIRGMLDGVDLDVENLGELQQDIGDELNEKYGRVERIFFNRNSEETGVPVFVKFTSELSALRAKDGLSGRVYGGNTISARFFNEAKFEAGDYEE